MARYILRFEFSTEYVLVWDCDFIKALDPLCKSPAIQVVHAKIMH